MKLLNKNEQIRIESVDQLKRVYEVLKGEWHKGFPFDDDIEMFKKNPQIEWCVRCSMSHISLYLSKIERTSITFDQFMSRVTPPLSFWEWVDKNGGMGVSNEVVEDYVQYRFEVGR